MGESFPLGAEASGNNEGKSRVLRVKAQVSA
jgi:hypothetical protein